MTASLTYAQFLDIVLVENNPQILFTVNKVGRVERAHLRSWGSIVITLLDAPVAADFSAKFDYARHVETLDA